MQRDKQFGTVIVFKSDKKCTGTLCNVEGIKFLSLDMMSPNGRK